MKIEYMVSDVDEFLDLVKITKLACTGDYLEAWNHEKSTPRLWALLINALFSTCPTHRYRMVKYLHNKYPNDKVLNYFMGLKYLNKDSRKALRHFAKARGCEYVDKKHICTT